MTSFFEAIKKQVAQGKLFFIIYYGPSSVSYEYIFPNWGEILKWVLKDQLEEKVGDYKKAYWDFQTANMGLDGASSVDLLERLSILVLDKSPDLVVLKDAGGNDGVCGIKKEITKGNTQKMIKNLLEKDIKVAFLNSVPSLSDDLNEKMKNYIEIYRRMVGEFEENENFTFVDLFNLFPPSEVEKSYSLISEGNEDYGIEKGEIDSSHCNKYGNAMMAKILLKEVFGIEFDHEKFLRDVADDSIKYPGY